MLVFIGDLIEGVLEFLADVFLLRNRRERNGRPENAWRKDAANVAYSDWWVDTVMAGVSILLFVVLFYGVELSFLLSIVVALVPTGAYSVYHWINLTRK